LMTMKFFSSIVVGAILCAATLGACKSPSTDGKATAEREGTEQNEAAPTEKPVPVVAVSQVVRAEKGEGKMAPNFFWKSADGTERSLKDYQGKVVLINFWATWCPPCRRELPDLVKLREELGPEGFEI